MKIQNLYFQNSREYLLDFVIQVFWL